MNARVAPELAAQVESSWLAAMRAGDFERAWQATDAIELPRRARQREAGFERDASHLVWDGTPFTGRHVRVRCLHGLGDTLQFMRFVPKLAAQASELDFLVQPMLLGLLEGAPGLGRVSNAWTDDPPPCELEIEVMELAYALRCTAATLPPPYPHLAAQLAGRRIALPAGDRPRVALLWAASDWDTTRSVPFADLAPLLSMHDVAFHSLQQGAAAEEALRGGGDLHVLSPFTQAIEDCAAAMRGMDLVIAIDGMPAHLAATLGVPTWLMLKHEADWRWMEAREDTPWYPAMRLFRQRLPGDWRSLVEEIAAALRSFVRRRGGD